MITIDVDGIDDALKKIESEGGSTVTPRTPIPGMGASLTSRTPRATCWVCGRPLQTSLTQRLQAAPAANP